MPNPFNFYQGGLPSGTGRYDTASIIDFFTGVYVPAGLELGKTVGFTWDGMGIRIADTTLNVSGSASNANKEVIGNTLNLFGRTLPLIKDSGSLTFRYSGSLPSSDSDKPSLSLVFKGTGYSDNIDKPNFSVVARSGYLIGSNTDAPNLSIKCSSGYQISDNKEYCGMTLSIRGAFNGTKDSNQSSISMILSNIHFSDTNHAVRIASGTGISINFILSNILYGNFS